MKPSKKTDRKPQEEEKVVHVKKRLAKPWRMEYMITDEKWLEKHSWYANNKQIGVWLTDSWQKYLSLEQALKELNKQARSGTFKQEPVKDSWRFAGRDYRMVNIETEEIVPLILGEREIYAEREEGGDSAGSPG